MCLKFNQRFFLIANFLWFSTRQTKLITFTSNYVIFSINLQVFMISTIILPKTWLWFHHHYFFSFLQRSRLFLRLMHSQASPTSVYTITVITALEAPTRQTSIKPSRTWYSPQTKPILKMAFTLTLTAKRSLTEFMPLDSVEEILRKASAVVVSMTQELLSNSSVPIRKKQ